MDWVSKQPPLSFVSPRNIFSIGENCNLLSLLFSPLNKGLRLLDASSTVMRIMRHCV